MKKLTLLLTFLLVTATVVWAHPSSQATPAFKSLISKKPSGHSSVYTVATGDNFEKISRKTHVTR